MAGNLLKELEERQKNFRPADYKRLATIKDGKAHLRTKGARVGAKLTREEVDDIIANKDLARACATFIISTHDIDRDRDVVIPKGCKPFLGNFKRNPRIFFDHQEWPLPVGSARTPDGIPCIDVRDDEIESTVYFHLLDAESERICRYTLMGELEAVSIGFMPIKAKRMKNTSDDEDDPRLPGYEFYLWDLMEWSICGTPANPATRRS